MVNKDHELLREIQRIASRNGPLNEIEALNEIERLAKAALAAPEHAASQSAGANELPAQQDEMPSDVDESLLPSVLRGDAETLRINDTRFSDIAANLEQAAHVVKRLAEENKKLAESRAEEEWNEVQKRATENVNFDVWFERQPDESVPFDWNVTDLIQYYANKAWNVATERIQFKLDKQQCFTNPPNARKNANAPSQPRPRTSDGRR